MNRNVSTFIGCENEYSESEIVLFGAPFDCTTSFRPGTRFASSAMRTESIGIETYSPYQDMDLEDIAVFDAGDLELTFGNAAATLDTITEFTQKVLSDSKVPFMIGGEHLVTLGTVRAVAEKYPDLHIIHFDAHADLRQDYMGERVNTAAEESTQAEKSEWEFFLFFHVLSFYFVFLIQLPYRVFFPPHRVQELLSG